VAVFAVTGAAGFIGSHLVDALLAAGHDVRGIDDLSTGRRENLDPRCDLIEGDVADPMAVRRLLDGASGCFHLAAIASVSRANEDWLGAHRTNQSGTIAVLAGARDAGRIPVVYASSAAVYGDLEGAVAREDMPARPLSAYGVDKYASEMHAAIGWRIHGVPSFGLRFFNVYGARQDPCSPYSGVISIFIRQISRREPVTLHGDGEQVRDFVHVADVVRGLIAAMTRIGAAGSAEIANICTGRRTSLRDLIDILARIHGHAPTISTGPARAGDIRTSAGDPSRAAALLGWSARVSLETGLAALTESRERAA
jgi:UDP-glucose 4-epimerase